MYRLTGFFYISFSKHNLAVHLIYEKLPDIIVHARKCVK